MENPALRLGASLYVPATRPDLGLIGNGERLPDARSVIFCTEDAVSDADLPRALSNLTAALSEFAPRPAERPLRFVRPRSDRVLATLLATPGIYNVDGFVLPKVTPASAATTLDLLAGSPFRAMITVETPEAFSTREMERLRDVVLESRADVLSVRVGGNDLLNLLGMRRERGVTAYETPLGAVVDRLVGVFRPFGVNVSAPVYDFTDDAVTLAREAREDLRRGTFGKTAIHPDQISVIEAAYVVTREDVVAAERILAPDAPAVFRVGGMMCEPATHR
ncbi:HpcH/HpaI aldolase/citrate lyase family protein, partial [Deinococcus pimensis]|uniref:HpcH/HpaI aldolase/citrate lyase family protein n=1 Tax=Deinococcus pimensis TaxID=309888 RepID=UPI0005EBDF51